MKLAISTFKFEAMYYVIILCKVNLSSLFNFFYVITKKLVIKNFKVYK